MLNLINFTPRNNLGEIAIRCPYFCSCIWKMIKLRKMNEQLSIIRWKKKKKTTLATNSGISEYVVYLKCCYLSRVLIWLLHVNTSLQALALSFIIRDMSHSLSKFQCLHLYNGPNRQYEIYGNNFLYLGYNMFACINIKDILIWENLLFILV